MHEWMNKPKRTNLYKEFNILTTSIGLLRAEISVNPTISLKKIVTQLNCSALTSLSSALTSRFIISCSATSFGSIWQSSALARRFSAASSSDLTWSFWACLAILLSMSPSFLAYHRLNARHVTVRDGQAELARDSMPGRLEWLWQVGGCVSSLFVFHSLRRHSDPESNRIRQILNQ